MNNKMTDKQFMEQLEKDFPNEDWDNLPALEIFPDVYIVSGTQWEITKWGTREIYFSIDKEYATKEEAEAQVQRCLTWVDIIPESVHIEVRKPDEAERKQIYKEWRQHILDGTKVFSR